MSSENGSMEAGQFRGGSDGAGRHSAEVQIKLLMGDASFDVSEIGAGRLTFSQPVTLSGAHGVVVLSIDRQERRWEVMMKPTPEPTSEAEATFGAESNLTVQGGLEG